MEAVEPLRRVRWISVNRAEKITDLKFKNKL